MIYNNQGQRLYLTAEERRAFLEAAAEAAPEVRTFCAVLHDTGCRISEALAVKTQDIDFGDKAIIFETLKKREAGHFRAVPVPDDTLDLIATVHGLKRRRRKNSTHRRSDVRLWPWCRATASTRVREVMEEAEIKEGPHRSAKGLRHGYGVHGISCGVPLNMLSKWMGHSSLEVTAIYANALGEEQRSLAARMWE
jgi:integrase/recombinase XerD